MRRRNKPDQPSRTGWDVVINPATKQTFDGYYDEGYRRTEQRTDLIAVRLTLDGKPHLTFETLDIADPEFEDKVTTAKAAAQERAAALNAVGASS